MNKKLVIGSVSFSLGFFLLFSLYLPNFTNATESNKNISAKDAYTLIEKNKGNHDFIILDIRTTGEFESGHIEKAMHVDYYSAGFKDRLSRLDKNKIYILHCKSGGRSGKTVSILNELHFKKVLHMNGGFDEWKESNLPVAR